MLIQLPKCKGFINPAYISKIDAWPEYGQKMEPADYGKVLPNYRPDRVLVGIGENPHLCYIEIECKSFLETEQIRDEIVRDVRVCTSPHS